MVATLEQSHSDMNKLYEHFYVLFSFSIFEFSMHFYRTYCKNIIVNNNVIL